MKGVAVFHIAIGTDPHAVRFGPFMLNWYALAILTGVLAAAWLTRREFVRKEISVANWDVLVLWTLVGGLIGARVFFVIDHFGYELRHPLEIFMFNQGGLAIYGAVLGGFVSVWVLSRRYRLPWLPVIDAIAPGLFLAQAIGRIGCTINGDAWGAPTSGPFALVYTNPQSFIPSSLLGVPTAPYPIYDLLMNLAIFALLWRVRLRGLPPGTLFAIGAAIYASVRFFLEFMRQERIWFWGLQEAQFAAILAFVAASVALLYLLDQRKRQELKTASLV